VVGTKKYKGLELDERTVWAAIHLAMEMNRLRASQKTRLGEKAAERKESFFEG
jgi:hypothetical protein